MTTLFFDHYELTAAILDPTILGDKYEIRDQVQRTARDIMRKAAADNNGLLLAGIIIAADYVGIQDARRMLAMMDASKNNTDCTNACRTRLRAYLG